MSSPFGQWMVQTRTAKKITLRDLEAATGIGNTSLSYIEKYAKDVPLNTFVKIVRALGQSPSSVMKKLEEVQL